MMFLNSLQKSMQIVENYNPTSYETIKEFLNEAPVIDNYISGFGTISVLGSYKGMRGEWTFNLYPDIEGKIANVRIAFASEKSTSLPSSTTITFKASSFPTNPKLMNHPHGFDLVGFKVEQSNNYIQAVKAQQMLGKKLTEKEIRAIIKPTLIYQTTTSITNNGQTVINSISRRNAEGELLTSTEAVANTTEEVFV